jgi:hypothetical protein
MWEPVMAVEGGVRPLPQTRHEPAIVGVQLSMQAPLADGNIAH